MQAEVSRLLDIQPEQLAAAAERARSKVSNSDSASARFELVDFEERAAAVDDLARLVDTTLADLKRATQQSDTFKRDISQLSAEMSQLQSLSATLHQRLGVRKAVFAELSPAVAERVVPPAVVTEICHGEIGPQWRAALAFVLKRPLCPASSSSGKDDSQQFVEKLLNRASARIKQWYINCVRRIRQPGTNCEAVQRDLVNNKALFEFLSRREPRLARRLHLAYCNTIRWYYDMLFGKYIRNIDRMAAIFIDKSKLLGTLGSSAQKSLFASASTAKDSDVFNIGSRPTILTSTDTAICLNQPVPHHGYQIEVIVRSLLLVLYNSMKMEQAVQEEAFANVFSQSSTSAADVTLQGDGTLDESIAVDELALDSETGSEAGILNHPLNDHPPTDLGLFKTALTAARATFTRLSHENYDIYGLILSLRLVQQMPKDTVEFNSFAQDMEALLLSEITFVLDANSKSIEQAAAKSSSQRAASEVSPHPMSQLFAQFLTGVLQISADDRSADEPIAPKLRQLTSGFEMFVTKLSKNSKSPELFLFTNYFVISALLSDVPGKLAGELSSHLRLLTEVYKPK